MKKIIFYLIAIISLSFNASMLAQPNTQMGGVFRPSYESYRLDKFIEEGEASYSGELNFSIPLLAVPGRHGHNFDIKISYNSNIRQRQFANWVGLGWNLEIGAVERTVNGRTDEPTHNFEFGSLGTNTGGGRGNMGGRFKPDFLNDDLEFRDVADQYHLLIDGGGMEIIPFNPDMYDSTYLDNQVFLPVQYKPWEITAELGDDEELTRFDLIKEDGTKYSYGNYGIYSPIETGQVEWIRVADDRTQSNQLQEYRFTYRWNLNSIKYPDGSNTTINYQFQNGSDNRLYRRYESVLIDRSQIHTSGVGNFFGKLPPCSDCSPCGETPAYQVDSVYYEYAYPTELITDTHYLKFKTSSNTGDSTSRNYRLDTLILYERYTETELKRVVFHYASENNPNGGTCAINYVDWSPNERLNHNQLTLTGFTIQNGDYLLPENPQGNAEDFQKYFFTYTTNPRINLDFISRYDGSGSPYEWPGYYSLYNKADLGKAWRLKTVTLPTGGRYTYEYNTLLVNYDPEGSPEFTNGWNYSSEPVSRLKTKKFEDGFNSQRIWTYSYSQEVVYDPPGYVNQNSYVPQIYRYNFLPYRELYYKSIRMCSIGHRWVKIDNPDGSWKKIYFTSSYKGTGDDREKMADDIVSQFPTGQGNIIAQSKAGSRGVVWKEEIGRETFVSTTNEYFYSYIPQGYLKDRYDYYGMLGQNSKNQYSLRTSIWSRLDSSKTTKDGVTVTQKFEYNQTMREFVNGNGLVKAQINKGSNIDRKTSYKYAYIKYTGMRDVGMRSQLYSTTITKAPSDDESKEFTTWRMDEATYPFWLPHKIFRWKGTSTDLTAPAEPTGGNVVNLNTFSYDDTGFNIISDTNANGFVTKYYYSNDINNPFINNQGGLRKGYLTGIEYPQSSPLLKESYKYDHFGNITHKTDENEKTTEATYDDLGRISSVINPLNQEIENFSYYLHNNSNILPESNPNSITTKSYRSLNDFTTTKFFYCGAGFERQKLIAFGDEDIISATTYDLMWRLHKSYKPYQVNLGVNKHKYDINYHNNCISDYGFTTPHITNEYFTDGTGRIRNLKPEGSVWQNTNFIKYSYRTNVAADNTGYSNGTLYKTAIVDENSIKRLEFNDKLGNLVQSVTDSAGLKLTTKFENDVLGNITKSTPPKGTSYSSNYTYNTLSQLTQKVSSDAGTVKYLYDKAGNLRFTQDANQLPSDKFTYQKYDGLNRLIEVGEYTASGSFTQANADNFNFPLESNPNKILQKKFYYDTENYSGQRNLKGNLSKSVAYKQGNITITTFFSYDENNRVEWILHQVPGISDKKISYWYDWQGSITKKSVSDFADNTLYTFYEYDEAGRLSKVFTNTIDNELGKVKEAEYSYRADGNIDTLLLGNAQEMNYVYNERSWLTAINNVSAISTKKLAEEIQYNTGDLVAAPQYNGNIAAVKFYNAGISSAPRLGYRFSYDAANRLTKAETYMGTGWNSTANYRLPEITYDQNSNIISLHRNNQSGSPLDRFTYEYLQGNRLNSITNTASGTQTYNYGYDTNGNVTSDEFRGISGITYNINNLPEQIVKGSSTINYWYDGNGNRIRKLTEDVDEIYVLGINGESEAVFDANSTIKFFNINAGNETIGRFIPAPPVDLYLTNTTLNGTYEAQNTITVENNVMVAGPTVLKAGNSIRLKPGFTAGSGSNFTAKIGTVTNTTKRFYYLKDHLGSIRVVVNETGEIVSHDDYDPWGMILNGRSGNEGFAFDKYKFTGKERDVETGYDYFGARYYDSRIGRWMQVDPLAEKYFGWSPYNYTLNNPLKYFDPDGKEPNKAQAGTVSTFINIFNNTPSKIGQQIGSNAGSALLRLGQSSGFTPTTTPFFNNSPARYIYTEKGGWVDMVHFLFYAGKGYGYKMEGVENPIGEAVQAGYMQEFFDQFKAPHSAYSYEDLPSDKFGADFGVNYFDPNSQSTLGEQLQNYLNNVLKAVDPENAPNYETIPQEATKEKPSRINKTTKPVYIEENP